MLLCVHVYVSVTVFVCLLLCVFVCLKFLTENMKRLSDMAKKVLNFKHILFVSWTQRALFTITPAKIAFISIDKSFPL